MTPGGDTPIEPCAKCGHVHDPTKCVGHNNRGLPCGKDPIKGARVCRTHGGSAPQVKRKAKLRLLEMVDPALARLMAELDNGDAKPAERLRAVENVLDRVGLGRQVTMDDETARALLLERLIARKQQNPTDEVDDDGSE